MPLIAVTGPARSGKSAWAESLAQQTLLPVLYVATGRKDPTDLEWQERLRLHQQRRPSHWVVREEPLNLAAVVSEQTQPTCLLIDSLGTWVANGLEDPHWFEHEAAFVRAIQASTATIICVSEEVGWGIVPAYPLGRTFRDRLGALQQQLAPLAKQLYIVIWGVPVDIKAHAAR